jgi:hypothetical protein
MKKTMFAVCVVALAALAFGGTARSDELGTLTLSNCGGGGGTGCPAATYNFDINSTSATLTITINGPVGSANEITGVDLGFTPSSNISGLSLASAPGGTSGWTSVTGSLSNNGCGGNGGAFVCASGAGVTIADGDTYTWTWDFTTGSGGIDGVGDVHIGANYGPANGLIVSETGATSPVPEPGSGTLALLGLGLISVAPALRRL